MNIIVDNNSAYSDVQFYNFNDNITEDKIKEFIDLLYTNSIKDYDKLIEVLESNEFNDILYNLINHTYDINITYSKINFDIIELLRGFNKIDILQNNKFCVIDILCELFLENNNNINKYIDYFWSWVETSSTPYALIDYRTHNKSLDKIILQCKNKDIRKEYFNKYLDIWDRYYPDQELPESPQPTETTDGENVFYLLAQNFMDQELIRVFSRASYDPKLYEWRKYDYNFDHEFMAVPLVSYLLQEFSYLRKEKDLEKLANTLNVLINYGKFNFDQQVIDAGYTVSDYLNHYGYVYKSSPVIHMFINNFDLIPQSNKQFCDYYNYNENKPYDMIWKKYEYTKDPSLIKDILFDIKEEYIKTGIDSDKFLSDSGIADLLD